MTATLWFGVLGPIEATAEGRTVAVGRRKERALLALLVAAGNRTVPLDRIIDLLWGDEPPDQATSSLHAYISNLRRGLEPDRPPRTAPTRLVTRPPGYALLVEPDEVDALRFDRLVADAAGAYGHGDLDRAEELLNEGLGLWRGPAYGEFGNEPFAIAEVLRLEELRATAVEDRLEIRLAQGKSAGVVAEAEALVSAAPTRERAWCHLMLGLYRLGRQTDALRAFQRARDNLAEHSGIDPGPELRRLESQILAQDPALQSARLDAPTPPSVPITPTGSSGVVRAPPTASRPEMGPSLVGRTSEIELLDSRLEATLSGRGQVILVSGEAGVGKTALVAELTDRARRAGIQAAVTTWPETLDRPALAPWVQVLEQLGPDSNEAVGPLRDALVASRTPTISVLDQLVSSIVERASSSPALVVCDDIQWAGELSHRMFRQLAEAAPRAGIMLVLVRRHPAVDEQPGLVATLATLGRIPAVTRLDLKGLRPEEVIEMITNATQITPSAVVGAAIHEHTEGNAFYALELGRLLGSEGALTAATPLDDMGVPATVRDVLRRRLDRLPDQVETLLGIAAVLGNEVEPNLVRQVAGTELEAVADQLDLAEAAGFLVRHPTRAGRYRFAHELVRAAILDILPTLHAAALHARSIDAIVETNGEDDARVVHRLARHAVQAAEVLGPEQAAVRIERSAIVSRSMLNLEQAIRSFRRALSYSEEMSPGPRRDGLIAALTTRVAQTEFLLNGLDAQIEARFRRALDLSRTGTTSNRVKVLLAYGTHALLFGAIDEAIDAGRELLDLGQPATSMTTIGGRYLVGFDALRHPNPETDRRLLEGGDRDDERFGVAPTIRAGASTFLDVIDGRTDLGRRRAIEVTSAVLTADAMDGWIQAWALAFTLPALVLADDADSVMTLTEPLAHRAPGIPHVDHTIDGCRAWALASTGHPAALRDLATVRTALADRGDVLFWLVLTLATARAIISSAPDDAAMLTAEASAVIDRMRLEGLRPWLTTGARRPATL